MATSVSIVGSTGSIGTQAVDVIEASRAADPDSYRLDAIGAHSSVAVLAEQARRLRPSRVAIGQEALAGELRAAVPAGTEVLAGDGAMAEIAGGVDVVLNAVVGFAGLSVTVAALAQGCRLALANKESLVAGAPVVARVRSTPGAEIVPVDSEHCAVHQCLRSGRSVDEVSRIILTASGGPFRTIDAERLGTVTLQDALAHPTWNMGPKITVDSSTLMNKGLEVIEAHELFGIAYEQIDVVVHPQSIVHSMVEFTDGAIVAQLSNPDMRLPIGYALAWPHRLPIPFGALRFPELSRLEFELPRRDVFRCLQLAYDAGRSAGTAPAWLNAANEVAVDAFLRGRLDWLGIAEVVEKTLAEHPDETVTTVEEVVASDAEARRIALAAVGSVRSRVRN